MCERVTNRLGRPLSVRCAVLVRYAEAVYEIASLNTIALYGGACVHSRAFGIF